MPHKLTTKNIIFVIIKINTFKYNAINNIIADEEIDGHLVYRLIPNAYNYWNKLGIYQRNLQNFDQKMILHNKLTKRSCINCHTFGGNSPDKMLIHSRASVNGMFLLYNNHVSLVNTN